MNDATLIQMKANRVSMLTCKDGSQRTVVRVSHGGGRWLVVSFGGGRTDYGDLQVNSILTFFYSDGRGRGVEWEPQYGPIQKFEECAEDWTGENCIGVPITAKRHWFFDFVKDEPANWSQLAVDKERLKEKLIAGDIDGIFRVLERWCS